MWQQWNSRDYKWLSWILRRIEKGMCIWGMQVTPGVMVNSSFLPQWREGKREVRTQPKDQVQFSSVAQSCPTLCDPMDCSTPGLPVHHQLLKFTQTHICRVGDAIQPSHPLSSPSPPAVNLSQHQGLLK